MADASTIQTLRSPDLVTTSILVDGEELSAEYQVLNIVVDKEVNRIPAARIVLLDGDPSKRTFEISERDLFIPGKEIEIKAGYHSDNETIFKGVVVKMSIKIRSGDSYLHVLCKDAAEKLTNGRKSRYFYDQADSDIIGMIADGHGLEKDIDNTTVQHDEMVQYNVTDWDFCVVRAQANGKVVIVDDGKISVKTPDTSQEEVETVTYGSTILDLDAEMDARDQAGSFKTTAWNVADQELKETEADEPDVEMNGNVPFDKLSNAAGHDALELKNGAAINDAELQQWANAKALFSRMAKVRGRVKFRGAAAVKPGKMLKLDGVGDRFNGKVFVSGVRHQIVNGGWTTDAQFGIDPEWFSEKNKINDLPAAGLLAAVHGLQVGIVTQIERDPEGEYRVLVNLPVIDDEEQGVWARIATLDAGDNRGSFFRPETGDEVIVGFVNDDPRDPVILGMMNSSAKPAPMEASDANNEKGFVTRSGMKLVFNDDKKSVVIETPGGKKVMIDEEAGVVSLKDEHSNSVTLSSSGIRLSSGGDINIKASGDVKIKGNNVEVEAGIQLTAKGTTGAEFSATGITVVKGALVQIN